MERRRFLSLAGAALVGATFDPERLLWVPGRKAIFDLHVPTRSVWNYSNYSKFDPTLTSIAVQYSRMMRVNAILLGRS